MRFLMPKHIRNSLEYNPLLIKQRKLPRAAFFVFYGLCYFYSQIVNRKSQLLQGLFELHGLVSLNNVSDIDVVEVVDVQSALIS